MADRSLQQLAQMPLRSYSRTEFTVLRARVQGLAIEMIERLSFDRDADERADVAQRCVRCATTWSRLRCATVRRC